MKRIALILAAVLAIPAAAFAYPSERGLERGERKGQFQKFGRHKRGMKARFDLDKNGKLDEGERALMKKVRIAERAERLEKFFDKVDTNKDGLISKSELAAVKHIRRGRKHGIR